jgi:hypothetical protein
MDWLRKAPTSVVITLIVMVGFVALGVIASYTWLTLAGEDTTAFRQWVLTIGVPAILSLLGVNTAATISAAKTANQAAEQTNGHLAAKDAELARVYAQLEAYRAAADRSPTPPPAGPAPGYPLGGRPGDRP